MNILLTISALFSVFLYSWPYEFKETINHIINNTIVAISGDSIPSVNSEILNFVNTKIKKKVGRGECWDLAAEALNSVGAKWDGKYQFGKEINPILDTVIPGDIIQFKGVKLKYEKHNLKYTENMSQHTAIIYAVKGAGIFDLAHQNNASSGKKVGISELNVKNIVKGEYIIYRPIR